MDDRTLVEVKKKFVMLMRTDPPPPIMGLPREPLAPIFDRWVAKRFSPDEVSAIFVFLVPASVLLIVWLGPIRVPLFAVPEISIQRTSSYTATAGFLDHATPPERAPGLATLKGPPAGTPGSGVVVLCAIWL